MGTDEKADYLRECMSDPALVSQPIPIDQFSRAFCVVCGYKPCVRSRANTMVFTERVATWQPRLFTNVPRADDNDPNYARIRAKNFQSVDEPLVVNTQTVAAPAPTQAPAPQPLEPPIHSTPDRPTESPVQQVQTPPAPVPLVAQPAPVTQAASVSAPHQEPTLDNTPFAGGIVLPGKPVDKKEDKFVEPGSTFTFGDDD
jgi:hypothetical protein